MYPILLELGGFQLRTYGVIVALSLLLGLWLSEREARRNDPEVLLASGPLEERQRAAELFQRRNLRPAVGRGLRERPQGRRDLAGRQHVGQQDAQIRDGLGLPSGSDSRDQARACNRHVYLALGVQLDLVHSGHGRLVAGERAGCQLLDQRHRFVPFEWNGTQIQGVNVGDRIFAGWKHQDTFGSTGRRVTACWAPLRNARKSTLQSCAARKLWKR